MTVPVAEPAPAVAVVVGGTLVGSAIVASGPVVFEGTAAGVTVLSLTEDGCSEPAPELHAIARTEITNKAISKKAC